MEDWMARVECQAVASAGQIRCIAQLVTGIDSVVEGRLTLELRITAHSLRQALNMSLDQAHVALQQAGVDGLPVAARVATEADYLAELAARPDIDIVGVAEIQQMLMINHRQQVGQLAERDDFPDPLKTLTCGRIWLRSDIQRFASNWQRRPGRPGGK